MTQLCHYCLLLFFACSSCEDVLHYCDITVVTNTLLLLWHCCRTVVSIWKFIPISFINELKCEALLVTEVVLIVNIESEWRLHFIPFTSMTLWQISGWLSQPHFYWGIYLNTWLIFNPNHFSRDVQGKMADVSEFLRKQVSRCFSVLFLDLQTFNRTFLQWAMPPKQTTFRACGRRRRPAFWIQSGRLISSEVMCVGVRGGLSFCSLSEPNGPDQPLNLSPVLLDDGPNEQLISPGALGNWEMTPEPASCANKIW